MTAKSNDQNASVKAYVELDGVEFINIYPHGKTRLGREISHFARTPFVHPFFGPFDSMEGFWYWLRSSVRDDKLRTLSGKEAKKYGKVLTPSWYPEFWDDILAADYQKIIQHPQLAQSLADSVLPFKNFYVFHPIMDVNGKEIRGPQRIIPSRDADKMCAGMEEIRNAIREDRPSSHWLSAEKRYTASVSNTGKL